MHDPYVTANVSIPSVGDLSGRRIYIEDVYPLVDAGRFPVKRIAGETVEVWADIFRDGHAVLAAELLWRPEAANKWSRVPMLARPNDRWSATFAPPKPSRYVYAIEAWTDEFATWRRDFIAKREAGMDLALEIAEGHNILMSLKARNASQSRLIREVCRATAGTADPEMLLSDELAAAASKGTQSDLTRSPSYPLLADRPMARAGAWYEMMPRSQSPTATRHGTFDDCIARLPDVVAMGFDVLYLTPINPIGRINRKGRNNSLTSGPDDTGSPYAIGSAGWSRLAPTTEWRSRWTSLSSAHLTILGSRNTRNGSSAGPTDRSSTLRTPRKNTRISSIQTSMALTARAFGGRCATWCCSGFAAEFGSFGSIIRTTSHFRSGSG